MPKRSPRGGDTDILRAAYAAAKRTQSEFAVDVLGVTLSGFGKWANGQPCPAPAVALCWAIAERPALADEIAAWRKRRTA